MVAVGWYKEDRMHEEDKERVRKRELHGRG